MVSNVGPVNEYEAQNAIIHFLDIIIAYEKNMSCNKDAT
jgi:hypothetical protein